MGNTEPGQRDPQSLNGLLLAPAYHKSGYEVVRALKQALDRVECSPGHQLEQKQFGCLLGVSRSTIHDWFHGKLAAPIQNFLCAFERLSETDRILFLREFCRQCARLEHPRLAHDAETLKRLKTALDRRAGLTIVVGPSEPRTFLVTAMGHSINRVEPTRRVCGLDAHRPESFVPVVGVYYCQHPPNPEQARQFVARTMEDIEGSKAELVIFNGVWSAISKLPRAIHRLAATRHLILADDLDTAFDSPVRVSANHLQVIAVSQLEGKQGLIHVDFPPPDSFRATNRDTDPGETGLSARSRR